MKKALLLLISILLVNLSSCENEIFPENIPDCIQESIKDSFKSSFSGHSVKLYKYNGENVYIFDSEEVYPDKLTVAYNQNCEVVCEFGGIAGLNTCPDFSENAELVSTLWKDSR